MFRTTHRHTAGLRRHRACRTQPMSYGGGAYELATHTGTHVYVILRLDATFSPDEVRKYQAMVEINTLRQRWSVQVNSSLIMAVSSSDDRLDAPDPNRKDCRAL